MHQISYFHMFSRKHIQVHRIAILDNDGYIYIVGIPLLLDTNCYMQELMSFCLHTVSYTDIGSVKTKSRDKVKQPTCDQWLTEIPRP